jgi:protein associated with RNAse G/E
MVSLGLYSLVVRPVTVQFLKNPDILHWGFNASYLGEDEFGHWIAVPTGTERWKGEQDVRPSAETAVFCAPHEGWWHLHYNGETTRFSHFVDIVTPPVWVSENRYEMIDLDLDVVVYQDGTIEIDDEDEFEVHQVLYDYTEELIQGALESTARVVDALREHREPFFDVAAGWLAKLDRG